MNTENKKKPETTLNKLKNFCYKYKRLTILFTFIIVFELLLLLFGPTIVLSIMFAASTREPYVTNSLTTIASGYKIHYEYYEKIESSDCLTIVWLHGNAENIMDGAITTIRNKFTKNFDEIIQVEYPGFSKAPGDLTEKNIITTIVAFLKHLKNTKHKFNKRKIVIGGWSLGGSIALKVADSGKEFIDGVVSVSPFTSARDAARNLMGIFKYTFWLRDCGFNVLDSINNLNVPVVLIGSEKDRICPFLMQEKIFKLLRENKMVKSKFIKIPGEDHLGIYKFNCSNKNSQSDFCKEMRSIKEFFF